jgi:hypothetical protein
MALGRPLSPLTPPGSQISVKSPSLIGHALQTIRWKMKSSRMTAAIPERRPMTEEISGVIGRVTFHDEESGLCVLGINSPRRGWRLTGASSPFVFWFVGPLPRGG